MEIGAAARDIPVRKLLTSGMFGVNIGITECPPHSSLLSLSLIFRDFEINTPNIESDSVSLFLRFSFSSNYLQTGVNAEHFKNSGLGLVLE